MTNHEIAKDYLSRIDSLTYNELADAMTYKWFRLNTLYHIKDKSGKKVLFTPNAEQEDFYLTQHGLDIILKARQLGFTTFKMISDLDDCLFTENHSAGCICHDINSAKDIYRNKIRFAYRGGTLQSLHVSEFGKICKKYPEKAKEIVTGAFEAVAVGNQITIESTAEGKEGYFFNYCSEAKKIVDSGRKPSVLEFAFHFYPWWTRCEYSIAGRIANALLDYFIELEQKHGITLTDGQKAWYSAKWRTLGDDMKREYPSTPEEAFSQSVEGAYYAKQFASIYADKRIGAMPKNDAPVHTAWDLGVGDSTAIWFYQLIGNKIHLIDFYENSGEGMRHYFKVLKDKAIANGWKYGDHFAPHDMNHAEFGSDAKSRRQIAAEGFIIDGATYAINFKVLKIMSIDEGIELVRELLPRCCFDEVKCEEGITRLEHYRKEWNDKLGCWRDKPLHDWSSHCADAFRYLAMAVTKNQPMGSINVSFYGR